MRAHYRDKHSYRFAKLRKLRRTAVLLAVLGLGAGWVMASPGRVSPPHLVEIVGGPAYVQRPDGQTTVLPEGSVFAAESLTYEVDARIWRIQASAEILRDGFE